MIAPREDAMAGVGAGTGAGSGGTDGKNGELVTSLSQATSRAPMSSTGISDTSSGTEATSGVCIG